MESVLQNWCLSVSGIRARDELPCRFCQMSVHEKENRDDDDDSSFVINVNKVLKTRWVMSQWMCTTQLTLAISVEENSPLWEMHTWGKDGVRAPWLVYCDIPFGDVTLNAFPWERNINILLMLLVITLQAILGLKAHLHSMQDAHTHTHTDGACRAYPVFISCVFRELAAA